MEDPDVDELRGKNQFAVAAIALQVRRDRDRLRRAREVVAVGKLSGAVGTYTNVDPFVERYVCERLGLRPTPASQVIARDRHAELVWACASVGATVEAVATEIRHLQRTEVSEVSEPFRTGAQKGSSAMPHKRNPVRSEQLCGLARVLRANLGAALENVALWHERDISHSSVERVILPDSCLLAYYCLVRLAGLVEDLVVHPQRMLANLEASGGLVFSQTVLSALVAAGMARDEAYQVVQAAAARTWETGTPLREVLAADETVAARLGPDRLGACFDLGPALAGAARIVDALDHADP